MFQSFEDSARPEQGPPRLAALRDLLPREGLTGFLVPRADAHQGEYVAPHDARLAWLTGFTGSAGFACVLPHVAGVFIDGRYRTQVKGQVDLAHFTPVPWPETGLADWLRAQLPNGGVIGFDPWLHTADEIGKLEEALAGTAITLRPGPNALDRIWTDQPAPPAGLITPYPDDLAGETSAAKRARLAEGLRKAGQSAAVLTLADSLAWLLNVRGADIPRNPVPHGFAVLHDNGHLTLFADPAKCDDALRAHLGTDVTLRPVTAFGAGLRSLTGPVRVDRATAPLWVSMELAEAGVPCVWGQDPCILPKATKTPAEIAATTEAHLRDAAAMVEFLCWFDAQPAGSLTEIEVATALEGFRRATNALRDISFETIAGTGPNGAIMHYRVSNSSNARLEPGHLIVVDSGGQYLDGTTDITRTLPVGEVGDTEKACFTRVLQGMIGISRLRFPKGLAGRDIDAIARAPLWAAGLDFNHGTGHGVGVYLCVHEGPQRISRISDVPLQPGMILSNEPGYYREGSFGIRIENLIVVREAPALAGADDRAMFSFDTLTWVPIDRRLVLPGLMTAEERAWLNAYHAACHDKIAPRLSEAARIWLAGATAPL
ncbi:aminopeptidase P family protein [Seohaeicola sp. SP36]|uniref:aminopeptidase P family protein n=1 Tax=unclassified Seohaeicola TaxID=2641111 RepID=UPI00237A8541|nr:MULTISPECIES: aminopeptidase P family protein [unclassified Seohaeicola]MDD9707591.1 aminopeptidase P family protein [Seohaeicola sp. 4SK31]MDD9735832.1 aminopeptidase P family protein [Seohaeicola sp. SP36]